MLADCAPDSRHLLLCVRQLLLRQAKLPLELHLQPPHVGELQRQRSNLHTTAAATGPFRSCAEVTPDRQLATWSKQTLNDKARHDTHLSCHVVA